MLKKSIGSFSAASATALALTEKSIMKLRAKQKLDHLIGVPTLVAVNFAARILGVILSRSHKTDPVRSVLIMKFQGMGSLVIAKPSLSKLRQSYPNAKIYFWGTKSTSKLAELMPEFDGIYTLDDQSLFSGIVSLFQTLFKLWSLKIDWAFDFEVYSKISSVITTLTCARNRAGFAVDSVRHRHFTHTHLLFFNRYEYLGNAYIRLLGMLNFKDIRSGTNDDNYGNWKFNMAKPSNLPSKYIVINPHAGELALERRWPIAYFSELISLILKACPEIHVVLVGNGSFEISESEKIINHSDLKNNSRLHNKTGSFSIQETISTMNEAQLVVSNDSAPLHFALTTKTNVLGLFGPTRAQTYFPMNRPNSKALFIDIYCSPCVHHWDFPPCLGNNQCLKQLSIQTVLNESLKLLKRENNLNNIVTNPEADSKYYPGLVYERKPNAQ